MVNRVLIRIKVVQMLYSYLLTKSEFKIDSAPLSASKDRRYAYNVYLDLLLLIIELSGYSVKADTRVLKVDVDKKLKNNAVGRSLVINGDIRDLILRGNTDIASFDSLLQALHDKIVSSAIYKDTAKKGFGELSSDVTFWTVVLETILAKDEALEAKFREIGGFTAQGFEQGIAQTVSTLKSYADSKELLAKAKNDLIESLNQAYKLYLGLFRLIIDITEEQQRRIETAKSKYIVSSEDLNPNTKLVDNALVKYLGDHEHFNELLDEYKIPKSETASPLVKSLLDGILASDIYKDYVNSKTSDFASDVDFWRNVMKSIILPSDALAEDMEDKSVFWNDDLQIMGTFVIKTLKQISQSEGKTIKILPKFKDIEDEEFGPKLFKLVVDNNDTYRQYIDKFVNNTSWDPERLAYMDIVILYAAIAELINFPKIPVPVTVNEYVDIANGYSTDKSGSFINGLLFNVIKYLNDEGIINKK